MLSLRKQNRLNTLSGQIPGERFLYLRVYSFNNRGPPSVQVLVCIVSPG